MKESSFPQQMLLSNSSNSLRILFPNTKTNAFRSLLDLNDKLPTHNKNLIRQKLNLKAKLIP